ncbi:hypothetical protein VFPPC_18151 [Pochonia chlamydosporia 170]|uniref:Uncharacterized protein n=1 Tax=Pochonia chlamydosporia 170 TaxID=1380566 RepID=A0A219APJ1_METCM|nr:hypothetical protein VFPPC_18151 [Pochonia chlamydosporia 170]OWT42738.1 hypothetical protein VFPPC_18151 [Pochonia chlamydosporia 170]
MANMANAAGCPSPDDVVVLVLRRQSRWMKPAPIGQLEFQDGMGLRSDQKSMHPRAVWSFSTYHEDNAHSSLVGK